MKIGWSRHCLSCLGVVCANRRDLLFHSGAGFYPLIILDPHLVKITSRLGMLLNAADNIDSQTSRQPQESGLCISFYRQDKRSLEKSHSVGIVTQDS